MTNEPRLYNLQRLQEMGNGDTGFIKQVIGIFLQNITIDVNELVKACNAKENKTIHFIAHKMKSSIDLMGIEKITQEIRSIEQAAKSDTNPELLNDKINFVHNIIQDVVKQMRADFDL